jgi:hypothetical protein
VAQKADVAVTVPLTRAPKGAAAQPSPPPDA